MGQVECSESCKAKEDLHSDDQACEQLRVDERQGVSEDKAQKLTLTSTNPIPEPDGAPPFPETLQCESLQARMKIQSLDSAVDKNCPVLDQKSPLSSGGVSTIDALDVTDMVAPPISASACKIVGETDEHPACHADAKAPLRVSAAVSNSCDVLDVLEHVQSYDASMSVKRTSTDNIVLRNPRRNFSAFSTVSRISEISAGSVTAGDEVVVTNPEMTLDQFRNALVNHCIDVGAYGSGKAKSVADFHRSVVTDGKSLLVERGPDKHLELLTELVRIQICCPSETGEIYHLRLASEILPDGRAMSRNMPLAEKVAVGTSWDEAVRCCIRDRFGLSPDEQEQMLEIDEAMYNYSEVTKESPSTPGITTIYMTHEVEVRVRDSHSVHASALGLPTLQPFTTFEKSKETTSQWHWQHCNLSLQESNDVDAVKSLLSAHGVCVDKFPPGAFEELCDEVLEGKYATLSISEGGEIERTIRIIKVWLVADISSLEHVLVCRWKIEKGKRSNVSTTRPISMRMLRDAVWSEALKEALRKNLGLDEEFQQNHFRVDEQSSRISEETAYSSSYPGLKTVYCINEVMVHVIDPCAFGMEVIGLPDGKDFSITRTKGNDNTLAFETMPTAACWCWKAYDEVRHGELKVSSQEANRSANSLRSKESAALTLQQRKQAWETLTEKERVLKGDLLVAAAKYNDAESIPRILAAGSRVDALSTDGGWALAAAARYGHATLVKMLVSKCGARINLQNSATLETALHIACKANHEHVIRCLVDMGAVINVKEKNGMLPYDLLRRKKPECAEWMKRRGCDSAKASLKISKNLWGDTLVEAAHTGDLETIRCLVSQGVSIETEDSERRNALKSVATRGTPEIMKLLITEFKVKLDTQNPFNGNTALHVACQGNKVEMVKMLVEHGADLSVRNKSNKLATDLLKEANPQLVKWVGQQRSKTDKPSVNRPGRATLWLPSAEDMSR